MARGWVGAGGAGGGQRWGGAAKSGDSGKKWGGAKRQNGPLKLSRLENFENRPKKDVSETVCSLNVGELL